MSAPVRRTPAEVDARARAATLGQIIEDAVIHRQAGETYDEAIRDRVIPLLAEELLAAETRGREAVQEFARVRRTVEERKLGEARDAVRLYLDPESPARLAAHHATDAHGHSSAIIALRLVEGWTP